MRHSFTIIAVLMPPLFLSGCKAPDGVQLLDSSASGESLVRLARPESELFVSAYKVGYSVDPEGCAISKEIATVPTDQTPLEAVVSRAAAERPEKATRLVAVGIGPLGITSTACAETKIDRKNSTVLQDRLEWLPCPLGQQLDAEKGGCVGDSRRYFFYSALAATKDFNTEGGWGGYTDWRVPTLAELATLRECPQGLSEKKALDGTPLSCVGEPDATAPRIAFPWLTGPLWSSLIEEGPVGHAYAFAPLTGKVHRILDDQLQVLLVRTITEQ